MLSFELDLWIFWLMQYILLLQIILDWEVIIPDIGKPWWEAKSIIREVGIILWRWVNKEAWVCRHYIPWMQKTIATQMSKCCITMTSYWPRWRLKSPASRLFTQPFIQTQIKENIKAPRHWPLCEEFTGTGEFPAQRASYAENVSIWWRHHWLLKMFLCYRDNCHISKRLANSNKGSRPVETRARSYDKMSYMMLKCPRGF